MTPTAMARPVPACPGWCDSERHAEEVAELADAAALTPARARELGEALIEAADLAEAEQHPGRNTVFLGDAGDAYRFTPATLSIDSYDAQAGRWTRLLDLTPHSALRLRRALVETAGLSQVAR